MQSTVVVNSGEWRGVEGVEGAEGANGRKVVRYVSEHGWRKWNIKTKAPLSLSCSQSFHGEVALCSITQTSLLLACNFIK